LGFAAAGFGLGFAFGLAGAALAFAGFVFAALARFSLLTPGRERGRLPRMPSFSSLIAILSARVTPTEVGTILLTRPSRSLSGSDRRHLPPASALEPAVTSLRPVGCG
jgi:hypothetical protein